MFTAIVLVCALETIKDNSTCYTYTLDRNLETSAECKEVIFEGVRNRVFYRFEEMTGYEYDFVDYQCVNWSAKRV